MYHLLGRLGLNLDLSQNTHSTTGREMIVFFFVCTHPPNSSRLNWTSLRTGNQPQKCSQRSHRRSGSSIDVVGGPESRSPRSRHSDEPALFTLALRNGRFLMILRSRKTMILPRAICWPVTGNSIEPIFALGGVVSMTIVMFSSISKMIQIKKKPGGSGRVNRCLKGITQMKRT